MFTLPTHTYSDFQEMYSYSREIARGIQLTDEQYLQHCKELIEGGEILGFGILRIINMVNVSTVCLLTQSLKSIAPSKEHIGEPFKYILHINSQQWRDIEMERKQELLNTVEGLQRKYPDGKKEWRTENDYNLMRQAMVKLSLLVGNISVW